MKITYKTFALSNVGVNSVVEQSGSERNSREVDKSDIFQADLIGKTLDWVCKFLTCLHYLSTCSCIKLGRFYKKQVGQGRRKGKYFILKVLSFRCLLDIQEGIRSRELNIFIWVQQRRRDRDTNFTQNLRVFSIQVVFKAMRQDKIIPSCTKYILSIFFSKTRTYSHEQNKTVSALMELLFQKRKQIINQLNK